MKIILKFNYSSINNNFPFMDDMEFILSREIKKEIQN